MSVWANNNGMVSDSISKTAKNLIKSKMLKNGKFKNLMRIGTMGFLTSKTKRSFFD